MRGSGHSAPCSHGSDCTRGLGFLWGALLPFVLRVVAGACVGRGTGQPRMPPRERQHERLGGDWGILSHALERLFGAVTPLERRDEDDALWFYIAGRRPQMRGYLKPALNRKERAGFQV